MLERIKEIVSLWCQSMGDPEEFAVISKWLDDHVYEADGKDDKFFRDLAMALRKLWPPGNKADMYPWRGSLAEITVRLKSIWRARKIKTRSVDEVVGVANRYLSNFEFDTTYMRTLKYFIYKHSASLPGKGGKSAVNCESILADMLENKTEQDDYDKSLAEAMSNIGGEGELI